MGALRTYKVQVTLEVEVRDDDARNVTDKALDIMLDRIARRTDRREPFNEVLKGVKIDMEPY